MPAGWACEHHRQGAPPPPTPPTPTPQHKAADAGCSRQARVFGHSPAPPPGRPPPQHAPRPQSSCPPCQCLVRARCCRPAWDVWPAEAGWRMGRRRHWRADAWCRPGRRGCLVWRRHLQSRQPPRKGTAAHVSGVHIRQCGAHQHPEQGGKKASSCPVVRSAMPPSAPHVRQPGWPSHGTDPHGATPPGTPRPLPCWKTSGAWHRDSRARSPPDATSWHTSRCKHRRCPPPTKRRTARRRPACTGGNE